MPGYSGTPLAKKLGLKAGSRVSVVNAPTAYLTWLEPFPDSVEFHVRPTNSTDLVHLFTRDRAELAKQLEAWRSRLKPTAVIWVSWPKKASKIPTDVTEDTIRELSLPLGFVDVKVCAVSDVWSGLKLVVRRSNRGQVRDSVNLPKSK